MQLTNYYRRKESLPFLGNKQQAWDVQKFSIFTCYRVSVRKTVLISVGICALVLSGCAAEESIPDVTPTASANPTPEETISDAKKEIEGQTSQSHKPTPVTSRTEVIWADYDPGLQAEIDQLTTAKDCVGIESFFGMTTATEESVKARTGHGNEALEAYLNESLSLAGCS